MYDIREHKTLFVFEGIAITILGLLAIALPAMFTLGISLLIGAILIVSGIFEAARAFQTQGIPGFIFSLLTGLIYFVIGFLLLSSPVRGALALTLLLTAYFILSGIAKIAWGIKLHPLAGWVWLVLSGIVALVMAGIIISGWPQTALWVIGLLVGIDLVFFGITLIALAFSVPSSRES